VFPALAEIVVINSTDYFLYLPLMPQVSGGLIEPGHVRISLPRRLRKTRFVPGTVNHVDPKQKVVSWAGPAAAAGQVRYGRLILAAGSVSRLLPVPGMTAQHAQRQGKQVARNVAATLGKGKATPYKHAGLGFLVDLGVLAGAANPLHVPLSGPAANAITRAYHLSAMSGNRLRVLTDWTLNGLTSPKRRRWTSSAPNPYRST
jgi:NADH dehydrogenase FAD-containing subunit